MDKTRISFYRILPALMLLLFLPAARPARAQKMQMIKGYCGIYYRQMDHLFRQKQAELDFYQFRPKQVVASIGAQCGHWEATYAALSDKCIFISRKSIPLISMTPKTGLSGITPKACVENP